MTAAKQSGSDLVIGDIFAGCGGLSFGATLSGSNVSFAVEMDKWAAQSFAANFPESRVICQDILDISDSEIINYLSDGIDILLGGPPCQGFSQSNINKDPGDPRNSLFSEFIRFVRLTSPKICILENVKGLLTAINVDGKRVVEIIIEEFENHGYEAEFKVLDAANYGVPQHRERLFIVAKRGGEKRFIWPKKTHVEYPHQTKLGELNTLSPLVTLGEAIGDLPLVTVDCPINVKYSTEPTCEFQRWMRNGFSGQLSHHEPMKHTKRIVERFKEIKVGQGESSANLRNKPAIRGKPEETSSNTYGQNHRRLSADKPSNTIPASSHTNFIHPNLHRNFTVRELMRIQSFPDSFTLQGKRAVLSRSLSIKKGYLDDLHLDQRQQIGNAVPPLLASALVTAAKNWIMECELV